ncbi:hypothetical protein M5W83_26675 [Paenibacillus thiaminolyticus]|uniref:Uncharacterized protein n=3 Tax=Paenibacillus thiaminolyticus TaxID=49283 RepID=A0AAP9DRE8_PANTH|nr:hypothetical protein [Paenibacillus thiaminolyticus]MCY9535529.1 hypothetical protein [Paenibacillus thiaminolyticus]MCY9601698.1 hypothetical protein [Paenibacillus thiaminolyticus]MCY9610736.1 hypothetical protein [Paenibacillus thiaminolyticus]MCY9615851.1 hypothetical protein [Paenibacillus thiaminolyticus]MCY9622145.1 hypothetical protein [Paenibacillus thiaminolyticus]
MHPLKYLASLVMQGLISQYEHEKAKDAYYRKWLLGKVFTSARELGTPTSWNDIASYVQRMAQSANELEQAYHQIPSDLRQRWKANYERYMAEQPKPEQEPSKSWLAILGEAQLMEAEAKLMMGQQMADGVCRRCRWRSCKRSRNGRFRRFDVRLPTPKKGIHFRSSEGA